jgi:hypothetical protein
MNIEATVLWIENILDPKRLNKIQRLVLEQTLREFSYREMADNCRYDEGYLKDTGAELWQWLSEAIGQPINKRNLRGVIYRLQQPIADSRNVDWGEAIDVSKFYGREKELETLKQWLIGDRCRVVGIFAFGGMGKTALSLVS